MSQKSNDIKCPHCGEILNTAMAQRNCSNCFSCTGCERYTCPHCEKEIIIQELQSSYIRNKKSDNNN